jgi:hypothetical protein
MLHRLGVPSNQLSEGFFIMREPDQQSPYARAWNLDLSKVPDSPQKDLALSSWLVNMPGAHAFWSYWVISLISLRETAGLPPAKRHYPEAEYEFMILAIDPERCPKPDPDRILIEGFPWLSPIDVIEQFHGISEVDCRRLAEGAIQMILSGRISPDQDYRSAWKQMIAGTVQHLIDGRHSIS